MGEPKELNVRINGLAHADQAELYELAVNLRSELLQLDLDGVDLADGAAPPAGARAASDWADGVLVLSTAFSAKVLRDVVRLLKSWIERNAARTVRLEIDGDAIEFAGVSAENEDRLVRNWIELHTVESSDSSG